MVDVLLRNMETNSMVHRHGVVAMPVLLLGEVEAFKLLQNDEPAPDLQSSTSSLRRAMAQIWHNRLCQKMLSFQHPFPQWDMDAPLILAERGGFEPPSGFKPATAFPVLLLQPLGHLSGIFTHFKSGEHLSRIACGIPLRG